MTDITAAMVKELRDATSAGMMECKRALQETDGDFDEAVKLLREKGMASAAKRADRATSEGKVGVMVRDKVGAIGAIGCETEPVSNNDDFLAYAEKTLRHRVRRRRCRRRSRTSASSSQRSSARTSRSSARSGSRLRPARRSRTTSTRRRTRSARSCGRRAANPPRPAASRCTSRSRGRRTVHATRSRRSSSTRSARSCRVRGGAREAGERPREDRRGPAQQALLRRGRPRRSRRGTGPTSRRASVAQYLKEHGIELLDYAWYAVA